MLYKPKSIERFKAYMSEIREEMTQPQKRERVLLVDGLNLFIRSFCAVQTTTRDGLFTGGLFGSLNSLQSAIRATNPSRVIMIFDGRGGSVKRKQLYPEYKGTRTGLKGLNRTFN